MRSPESEGASIVMIGSFNPTIFHPRWLGTQGLIRPEEAENAKIAIIRNEVADFSTEWFQLQVLQNRFILLSTDPRQYSPLRDLAAAIFAILPHTPITALGINRNFQFKMPSSAAWHGLGHLLAPKNHWDAIMAESGLRSMLMEGRRKQVGGGTLQIKLEPSTTIGHGLVMEVNEQFNEPDGQSESARWVPNQLTVHWDDFLKFTEEAAEHLLGLVNS